MLFELWQEAFIAFVAAGHGDQAQQAGRAAAGVAGQGGGELNRLFQFPFRVKLRAGKADSRSGKRITAASNSGDKKRGRAPPFSTL